MTLIKSILLGSAAGIVAVASAQAADLPTKKAAPVVQYVRICNVGGITGWTLPGSDTCVKLSGYITAQFTGGNLETQYNCGGIIQPRGGYHRVRAPDGSRDVRARQPLLRVLCSGLGADPRPTPAQTQRVLICAATHAAERHL